MKIGNFFLLFLILQASGTFGQHYWLSLFKEEYALFSKPVHQCQTQTSYLTDTSALLNWECEGTPAHHVTVVIVGGDAVHKYTDLPGTTNSFQARNLIPMTRYLWGVIAWPTVDETPGNQLYGETDFATPEKAAVGKLLSNFHVTTLDSGKVTYMAAGEFTMVEMYDWWLALQIRQCVSENNVVVRTCAVALRCSDASGVMELYAEGTGDVRLMLEGVEISGPETLDYSGLDVRVRRNGTLFEMLCASGFEVLASVRNTSKGLYVDMEVHVHGAFKGRVHGLMGTYDDNIENDIRSREGTVWRPGRGNGNINHLTEPSLDQFQETWRVTPDKSLFSSLANSDTRNCSAAIRRMALNDMFTLYGVSTYEAHDRCWNAGLREHLLDLCVFDYRASNGDGAYVDNAVLNIVPGVKGANAPKPSPEAMRRPRIRGQGPRGRPAVESSGSGR